MTKSTIQLAKGYDPAKLDFPVMVSEKLDGVPTLVNLHRYNGTGYWTARSRQDNPQPSIRDQVMALMGAFLNEFEVDFDIYIVAEVTHTEKGMPFKDVSGHVRRNKQNDDLVLNIFDASVSGVNSDRGFGTRIIQMDNMIKSMGTSPGWRIIPQMVCHTQEQLDCALRAMTTEHDGWLAEGAVVRSMSEKWQPGKRTWGYQKFVIDPTIELLVKNYEEATSKSGEKLGMVGRINCWYKGGVVGVGPGKMSHVERTNEWNLNGDGNHDPWNNGVVITVKYKRDDSYTALRQPTFQHFRPELKGTIKRPD